MPFLIALVWTTTHPMVPYVWSCSGCGAVFDAGPQREVRLTTEQLEQVNTEFELHCQQAHTGLLPVIGLSPYS